MSCVARNGTSPLPVLKVCAALTGYEHGGIFVTPTGTRGLGFCGIIRRTNVVAFYDKQGYNLGPYGNPCSVTRIWTLFLILLDILVHKNVGINTNLWTEFTNKQYDHNWSLRIKIKTDKIKIEKSIETWDSIESDFSHYSNERWDDLYHTLDT